METWAPCMMAIPLHSFTQHLQIYVAIHESMISFAALLGAYPVAYGFGFDHRGVLRSINIYILAENIVVVIKIILKVCMCMDGRINMCWVGFVLRCTATGSFFQHSKVMFAISIFF